MTKIKAGDQVVIPANNQLWGVGSVKRFTKTDQVIVGFGDGAVEQFSRDELVLLTEFMATDPALAPTPA